ncbi:MAG: hypothetical protein V4519_02270 [Patescibacteria group bacterium]
MLIRILLSTIILLTPALSFAATSSNGVDVNMFILGCNDNAICEPLSGEDVNSCPLDCTVITPPPPPPSNFSGPAAPYSGGGYFSPATYTSFEITPGDNYAVFTWTTDNNTINTFSWGETPDYEFGSMSEVTYHKNHSVKIQGLKPGVDYYYKITTQDASGATLVKDGTYRLPVSEDHTPPSNPSAFYAQQRQQDVLLTWKNPKELDFKNVLIVRSPYGYPQSGLEGKIVYEGKGNYVLDSDTQIDATYYYTIFAYDEVSNRSSGAIARIKIVAPGSPIPSNSTVPPITGEVTASSTLSLIDFDFSQRGRGISFLQDVVPVNSADAITVSLAREKVPKNVKYIVLTLKDEVPWNSYLFSDNFDKTTSETSIAALERVGVVAFELNIAYQGSDSVTKIEGYFKTTSLQPQLGEKRVSFWENFLKLTHIYRGILLIVLLIIIIIILGIIRHKKDKRAML